MEFQTNMQDLLNYLSCPAFSVKEHTIDACNQAAEGLLITCGTDVRTLLLTGTDAYEAFQDGCLYLKLKLSASGYGATVTREGDHVFFLLDQEPEDAALRSLALAARELRNPLSNMIIASDKLSQLSQKEPGIQEWLARLNRGLNQMHRLVNNMSDAARNEMPTKSGLHEWNKLIYDIFERIQNQLSHTNIHLTYEGLQEEVYGYSNDAQLERAILNVVSNAMKFMPEGGHIQAKLTRHHNMLHLSIADSGSGIAESIRSTVFRRYQRQPSIEDSRFGIGLGMVLVRNTAANHGGAVLIDCPDGTGTRVTITLEIRQDASEFKDSIHPFLTDDSKEILRELSDCLSWEFYK